MRFRGRTCKKLYVILSFFLGLALLSPRVGRRPQHVASIRINKADASEALIMEVWWASNEPGLATNQEESEYS